MYFGYQENLFKSSWATNIGFEKLRDELNDLLPAQGRCEGARSHSKALEKFRVAQNLIYDLFNNGLMNRKNHFRQFFGWAPMGYDISSDQFKRYERMLEPVMTQIMQEAAIEQGVR